MAAMTLALPIDPQANQLLVSDPLALLVGMVLDQQVSMEKAFSSPYVLTQRLGHDLDAREIAGYDPEALVALFAQPPALHRFPKAMAARVQEVCRALVAHYDGDAARLWADAADGRELLARIAALPGFGRQKAQIFLALLGKRFGVQPPGWQEAAGDYGDPDAHRSVADVTDAESLRLVREYKQQMKAAAKAKATGA
ncbi:Fe-S cluster assembly protein HesB [Micromonospora fiedleri]|uniref:Fe-S cluster assembly protein HesB n=3 Tax=Micromonosporaceae TaxID=28056 RepID=A0A9X0LG43_9ACTN|nr:MULTISPECIES: HhH-GPD-type base excision DNA repair protein [Micromonospora]KUJ48916.1 Fe-S cluster assembly protein HesB [Micromonospora maris]MBL6274691.1 Fe-S cluster assembly protein HesB [Micromonospora fiedleri]RUL91765.1 Fe-S cluster assembly protein HesB [Verrucosispora sp. FIM060022]